MHERTRAPERYRPTQPTSEAWHELSRFVADTKSHPARKPGQRGEVSPGDRSG